MTVPRMTRSLEGTLKDFVIYFRQAQPNDFIAAEFLVSNEVIGSKTPLSKLAHAIRIAESTFPKQGFNWWEPPAELGQIVKATSAEVMRSGNDEDAIRLRYPLITEESPPFLSHIRVH